MVRHLSIQVPGQGLHLITPRVDEAVHQSGVREGLCTVFLQHTSASLLIQENADPSARRDLERWLNRLVPERDPLYTHTAEGPDDMPSHIKAALTATSLAIPVLDNALAFGRWQGLYLWEHRRYPSERHLLIHLTADPTPG
jgi:secondary thiamine-phosphate synthase enzyme